MKTPALILLLTFLCLSPLRAANAVPITAGSIVNPGFEVVGADAADGLRTTPPWSFSNLRAARAFAGRDGIDTGSDGYMRLITAGVNRGETSQDITGSTTADTLYTFGATAYSSPNSEAGLADYQVTMKLFEVGRGNVVGGPTIDHAQPILVDFQTVTIASLGGTEPISVQYLDDSNGVDLELRIQFESAIPLPNDMFTRGGVDDVTLATVLIPEPATVILLVTGFAPFIGKMSVFAA